MIILVTGSREFDSFQMVDDALHKAIEDPWERFEVVHGNCPTGADAFAAHAVDAINDHFRYNGWPPVAHTRMPANWTRHGKAAGPIRNRAMVDYVKANPDPKKICLAFLQKNAKNAGTYNCTATAVEAGIPVTRFWSK